MAILKALTDGSFMSKELGQKLGMTKGVALHHLTGTKNGRPGLIKQGLVERSGSRTSEDPFIYRLTEEGRQVMELFELIL